MVGNNEGDASDAPLRYAEADATRVYEVLRDLGSFVPANMLLLKGEDARTLEDTIIAVNERVRLALSRPGSQVMLLVYYSGHADADALHLGRTLLPTRRLSQLIHGSAATFRLMVLDACRSGTLTRTKGGQIVEPSVLLTEDALPGSGLAVLAASAAHEDAQESEDFRGSFFTHAFVSGLMGAADLRSSLRARSGHRPASRPKPHGSRRVRAPGTQGRWTRRHRPHHRGWAMV